MKLIITRHGKPSKTSKASWQDTCPAGLPSSAKNKPKNLPNDSKTNT